jgi:hypothetical protein
MRRIRKRKRWEGRKLKKLEKKEGVGKNNRKMMVQEEDEKEIE